jgi:glycerol-3-phosphate dehydrogenase
MSSYDVLVVGGGVNGSGVARDCAMRGLKTLLIDKHDICHGASGANTGMIHGGARYLLYDVNTAKESCTDSGYIQRIAPHLLFRIPFLVPFFRSDPLAEVMMAGADMFFSAYDYYQPLKRGKRHVRLTRKEALSLEAGHQPGDCRGLDHG